MKSIAFLLFLLLQWVTADQTFVVTNQASSAYILNPGGNNAAITVTVGETITFNVNAPNHPFLIKTQRGTGGAGIYTDGVTGTGAQQGTVTWVVQADAPATLYYQCEYHAPMGGQITVNQNNNSTTGAGSTTTGEATSTTGEGTTTASPASTTGDASTTGASTTASGDGHIIAASAYLLLAMLALLI